MSDLDKKIIGSWADIRDNSSGFYKLVEFFKVKKEDFKKIIRALELSVEEGIIEYKNAGLAPVFRLLEDLKYRAVNLPDLKTVYENLNQLLFVILLQRLVAAGVLKISTSAVAEGIPAESIEIKSILSDVLSRIKENPEARKHPAIKNILVQFSIYKSEKETMGKLSANIKDNASGSFYTNFDRTFGKIFGSIRKNYALIMEEDASKSRKQNILSMVPIKNISPILFRQAKDISRISAMFEFAQSEKYKIREMLLPILQTKEATLHLIKSELKQYDEMGKTITAPAAGPGAQPIRGVEFSLRFCKEIILILSKYMEKEFPEQGKE